jgi:hypothetical protein
VGQTGRKLKERIMEHLNNIYHKKRWLEHIKHYLDIHIGTSKSK